jgi:hypothetical protein
VERLVFLIPVLILSGEVVVQATLAVPLIQVVVSLIDLVIRMDMVVCAEVTESL